jgi:hypothetical protein
VGRALQGLVADRAQRREGFFLSRQFVGQEPQSMPWALLPAQRIRARAGQFRKPALKSLGGAIADLPDDR